MAAQSLSRAFALSLLWLFLGPFVAAQSASAKGGLRSTQLTDRQQAPSDRQLGGIHPGSISDNIYTNRFFGISLEIPEGWTVAESLREQALQEKRGDEFKKQQPDIARFAPGAEVNMPLLVMGEPLKPGRRLIIASTNISTRPGPASAEEYLKYVAMISKEKGLPQEYGPTIERVMVDGRALWKTDFTQTTTTVWYGVHFAMIVKKHILQFVLYSPDQDGLRELEAVMRTLHFELWAQHDRQDIAVIKVEPARPTYSGSCPLTVRFKAMVDVDHAPVALTYWWERSDGTKTKAQVMNIPTDGKLTISEEDSWATGIPRESKWAISDRIHIRLEDVDFVSDPALTSLSCRPSPR